MNTFQSGPADPSERAALNHAVNLILAKHGDVITRRELSKLGLGRRAIARWCEMRRLYRVSPGVYAAKPLPLSRRGARWAALESVGPQGALAFLTAADLARIDEPEPDETEVHVVRLGAAPRARPGVIRHRTLVLPPRDLTVIDGLRCTSVSRTLLDCASIVTAVRLDAMLDQAVARKRYDPAVVLKVLKDRPGAPGTHQLVAAIGRLDETSGQFRSEFERRTVALVRESRQISVPVVNQLADGFRPDLGWLDTRAIVECDGRDYHRSPAQILSDAQRERILIERGFVLLRLRWNQVVYEPERTLLRIERFVLGNQAPPVPGVVGRVVFG